MEGGKNMKYIYLIPELLDLVDNSIIKNKRRYLTLGITTAVELSYLRKDAQKLVFCAIEYKDLTQVELKQLR